MLEKEVQVAQMQDLTFPEREKRYIHTVKCDKMINYKNI